MFRLCMVDTCIEGLIGVKAFVICIGMSVVWGCGSASRSLMYKKKNVGMLLNLGVHLN